MKCDYKGCSKFPHAEVYPKNAHTWSYLCKKHYKQEYKKWGNYYGWYELSIKEKVKLFPGWLLCQIEMLIKKI